mmetsp:Transcript_5705/g.8414  ORF Transcript_5705/g.8414 Transcript_5705/m.8414 type:complete len:95 (+) Transcript_5705:292-576(+)
MLTNADTATETILSSTLQRKRVVAEEITGIQRLADVSIMISLDMVGEQTYSPVGTMFEEKSMDFISQPDQYMMQESIRSQKSHMEVTKTSPPSK